MKKVSAFFFSVCTLLLAGACSQRPAVSSNEFLISGQLENVPDSAVIELRVSDGQLLTLVTSDTVVDGKFSLSDTITGGVKELLLMSSSKGFPGTWLSVWVAPGEWVKVTGSDKLLKTWTVESNVAEQQEENNFTKASFPEQRTKLEYQAQEYDLLHTMMTEHADDEAYQKECWKQIDSIRQLEEPLKKIILQKELAYLKTAPVSTVWLERYLVYASFLQWKREDPNVPEIKALYARMSDADKATRIGTIITEFMHLEAEVNVGDPMVDGDLYDPEGNLHHLSEFEGQYILLDFWSMGCDPCVQSIPEMEEIVETYKDKLAVVSINGDGEKNWKEYIAEKKMTGNQWNELRGMRTGLAARYKAVGIPHYVLISPQGIVLDMWSGYGKGSLKGKLKELLK